MEDSEITVLLNAYERAQENAHYNDSILWEAAAIIWSGNALLMGFMLEAVSSTKLRVHLLIVVGSLLGIAMTVFLLFFSTRMWHVEQVSLEMCQRIEQKLQMEFRLHSTFKEEDCKSKRIRMRPLFRILSALFIVGWLVFSSVSLHWICRDL